MPKRKLELELETEGTAESDHPASRMFSNQVQRAPKTRARSAKQRPAPKSSKKVITAKRAPTPGSYNALKPTDKAVIDFLKELRDENRRATGENTCKASIPDISDACNISERQVQISTQRLIKAKLLQRVGYDFGNPDKAQRGTIYEVLI